MNTYGPKGALQPTTAIAGAAISKGVAVKRGADADHVVHGTAASVNLGIAVEDQDTAERAIAIANRPGEIVEGRSGAAFALDAHLASDANGKLVTAVSTNPVIAIAREAATAADQLVAVEIIGHPYLEP